MPPVWNRFHKGPPGGVEPLPRRRALCDDSAQHFQSEVNDVPAASRRCDVYGGRCGPRLRGRAGSSAGGRRPPGRRGRRASGRAGAGRRTDRRHADAEESRRARLGLAGEGDDEPGHAAAALQQGQGSAAPGQADHQLHDLQLRPGPVLRGRASTSTTSGSRCSTARCRGTTSGG